MALPTSGPITLAMIRAEFGGGVFRRLKEYYGVADGVPQSGPIKLKDFYGKSDAPTLLWSWKPEDTLGSDDAFKPAYNQWSLADIRNEVQYSEIYFTGSGSASLKNIGWLPVPTTGEGGPSLGGKYLRMEIDIPALQMNGQSIRITLRTSEGGTQNIFGFGGYPLAQGTVETTENNFVSEEFDSEWRGWVFSFVSGDPNVASGDFIRIDEIRVYEA